MKEASGEYHEPREPQDGRTPEETAADAERMMRAILGITDKPSKPKKLQPPIPGINRSNYINSQK